MPFPHHKLTHLAETGAAAHTHTAPVNALGGGGATVKQQWASSATPNLRRLQQEGRKGQPRCRYSA